MLKYDICLVCKYLNNIVKFYNTLPIHISIAIAYILSNKFSYPTTILLFYLYPLLYDIDCCPYQLLILLNYNPGVTNEIVII